MCQALFASTVLAVHRAEEWADVAELLRAQRQVARLSLRSLARLTKVSDSYLSQVERGLHQPSPEILKVWAGALGIPASTLYERLGWLEDEDPARSAAQGADQDDGVEAAIARDGRLTDGQKKALLGMYRTLVGEE